MRRRVAAAFTAAACRLADPRLAADLCACRDSAVCDAAARGSFFNACFVARERVAEVSLLRLREPVLRGFDLSLGMAVSVISVATALATTGLAAAGAPAWLILVAGLAVGLGVGMLVGIFNGFFVSWVGINPFVVTLGSLNICYGLATTISGGRPVFNVPDAFTRPLYEGTFIPGVPIPVTLAVVVAVFLYFLLDRTVFGRALYLIGNNPRAAHLAGLPSKRYLFLAYVTCSLLAAFGSLMLTARTGSGEPNLGGSLMLESIAAAVIGGVSLQGGVGGIVPAILGSVFVTMLSNAMDLLEVGGYVQQILLGCVIIAAIFLDRVRATRA